MSASNVYRENAAIERAAAAAAPLSIRRLMHQRSAEVWDEMAQLLEDTAIRAEVNAASKATAPYSGQRRAAPSDQDLKIGQP